eukprot:TRINITY_DN8546_c0_g1_i3.p1 TRINITY_DN8546_c0_g1~~TRINITY_DN8546_c0_g1_i3.p1  ORF type:complete len:1750 (+),score=415.55 TRINITY_DN8546_c0_g1_i3:399-5252(+)
MAADGVGSRAYYLKYIAPSYGPLVSERLHRLFVAQAEPLPSGPAAPEVGSRAYYLMFIAPSCGLQMAEGLHRPFARPKRQAHSASAVLEVGSRGYYLQHIAPSSGLEISDRMHERFAAPPLAASAKPARGGTAVADAIDDVESGWEAEISKQVRSDGAPSVASDDHSARHMSFAEEVVCKHVLPGEEGAPSVASVDHSASNMSFAEEVVCKHVLPAEEQDSKEAVTWSDRGTSLEEANHEQISGELLDAVLREGSKEAATWSDKGTSAEEVRHERLAEEIMNDLLVKDGVAWSDKGTLSDEAHGQDVAREVVSSLVHEDLSSDGISSAALTGTCSDEVRDDQIAGGIMGNLVAEAYGIFNQKHDRQLDLASGRDSSRLDEDSKVGSAWSDKGTSSAEVRHEHIAGEIMGDLLREPSTPSSHEVRHEHIAGEIMGDLLQKPSPRSSHEAPSSVRSNEVGHAQIASEIMDGLLETPSIARSEEVHHEQIASGIMDDVLRRPSSSEGREEPNSWSDKGTSTSEMRNERIASAIVGDLLREESNASTVEVRHDEIASEIMDDLLRKESHCSTSESGREQIARDMVDTLLNKELTEGDVWSDKGTMSAEAHHERMAGEVVDGILQRDSNAPSVWSDKASSATEARHEHIAGDIVDGLLEGNLGEMQSVIVSSDAAGVARAVVDGAEELQAAALVQGGGRDVRQLVGRTRASAVTDSRFASRIAAVPVQTPTASICGSFSTETGVSGVPVLSEGGDSEGIANDVMGGGVEMGASYWISGGSSVGTPNSSVVTGQGSQGIMDLLWGQDSDLSARRMAMGSSQSSRVMSSVAEDDSEAGSARILQGLWEAQSGLGSGSLALEAVEKEALEDGVEEKKEEEDEEEDSAEVGLEAETAGEESEKVEDEVEEEKEEEKEVETSSSVMWAGSVNTENFAEEDVVDAAWGWGYEPEPPPVQTARTEASYEEKVVDGATASYLNEVVDGLDKPEDPAQLDTPHSSVQMGADVFHDLVDGLDSVAEVEEAEVEVREDVEVRSDVTLLSYTVVDKDAIEELQTEIIPKRHEPRVANWEEPVDEVELEIKEMGILPPGRLLPSSCSVSEVEVKSEPEGPPPVEDNFVLDVVRPVEDRVRNVEMKGKDAELQLKEWPVAPPSRALSEMSADEPEYELEGPYHEPVEELPREMRAVELRVKAAHVWVPKERVAQEARVPAPPADALTEFEVTDPPGPTPPLDPNPPPTDPEGIKARRALRLVYHRILGPPPTYQMHMPYERPVTENDIDAWGHVEERQQDLEAKQALDHRPHVDPKLAKCRERRQRSTYGCAPVPGAARPKRRAKSFTRLPPATADPLAAKLMAIADRHSKNGQLSVVELETYLGKGTLGGSRFQPFLTWLTSERGKKFKRFDSDHDGTISMEELHRAMDMYRRDVAKDDAGAGKENILPDPTRSAPHLHVAGGGARAAMALVNDVTTSSVDVSRIGSADSSPITSHRGSRTASPGEIARSKQSSREKPAARTPGTRKQSLGQSRAKGFGEANKKMGESRSAPQLLPPLRAATPKGADKAASFHFTSGPKFGNAPDSFQYSEKADSMLGKTRGKKRLGIDTPAPKGCDLLQMLRNGVLPSALLAPL